MTTEVETAPEVQTDTETSEAAQTLEPNETSLLTDEVPVAEGEPEAKEGEKTAETKEGDKDKAPKEGAPESYESFVLPEGISIDEGILGKFDIVAKDLNLSQEQAQKVIDLANDHAENMSVKTQEAWTKVRDGWVSDLKTDKEFGGAKYNETCDRARRVIRNYADEGFLSDLRQGFGDNPGLARMLAKIDRAMGEDKVVEGGPSAKQTLTAAEIIYGK